VKGTTNTPSFLYVVGPVLASPGQTIATFQRKIVGPVFASPGQTIATFQRNISQHRWPSICKPRPNDRNISTQHIATLLGATCWVRLATLLRRVATCWVLNIELVRMAGCNIVARTWPNDHNIKELYLALCFLFSEIFLGILRIQLALIFGKNHTSALPCYPRPPRPPLNTAYID